MDSAIPLITYLFHGEIIVSWRSKKIHPFLLLLKKTPSYLVLWLPMDQHVSYRQIRGSFTEFTDLRIVKAIELPFAT